MLINIDEVQVSDRIRKDFGNIEELAQDIKENGLINPPVVTPEHILIAGERRLRAMKHLDFKQIEVRVMSVKDAEHALNLEISENETRKDFSKLERLDYARRLERIESVKAKERQAINGSNNLGLNMQNFAYLEQGTTRDLVAEKIGIGSGETYRKEKFIADNADPELLKKWDEGDITTHKAYIELKEQLAEKDKLLQQEKEHQQRLNQRINNINYNLIEEQKVKDKYLTELAEKDKQIKKLKAEVKTEIIYEESPELQKALWEAQQEKERLKQETEKANRSVKELQKELENIQLTQGKRDELEQQIATYKLQIHNLKQTSDKFNIEMNAIGVIKELINRLDGFLSKDAVQITLQRIESNRYIEESKAELQTRIKLLYKWIINLAERMEISYE